MKELILLRHAKSSWEYSVEDRNRSLTEKGVHRIKPPGTNCANCLYRAAPIPRPVWVAPIWVIFSSKRLCIVSTDEPPKRSSPKLVSRAVFITCCMNSASKAWVASFSCWCLVLADVVFAVAEYIRRSDAWVASIMVVSLDDDQFGAQGACGVQGL